MDLDGEPKRGPLSCCSKVVDGSISIRAWQRRHEAPSSHHVDPVMSTTPMAWRRSFTAASGSWRVGSGLGGGGGNRTRVRKRSAFGSTCLAASFHLTASRPDGQGCETASLGDLTASREAIEAASLCESTSGTRTHRHVTVEGWLPLRRPERSCRRWQLMCCSRIYEEAASSACTSGFITHVEAVSPPLRGGGIVRPGLASRQCRGVGEWSRGPSWTTSSRRAAAASVPRRRWR